MFVLCVLCELCVGGLLGQLCIPARAKARGDTIITLITIITIHARTEPQTPKADPTQITVYVYIKHGGYAPSPRLRRISMGRKTRPRKETQRVLPLTRMM